MLKFTNTEKTAAIFNGAAFTLDAPEHWESIGDGPTREAVLAWLAEGNTPEPAFAPEELIVQALIAAKVQRQVQVENIKVTTQMGHEFDGDEISQGRMARAIIALQATGTPSIKWVLANNVPTIITVAELIEALALAGGAQATVWSSPYEN